jgi:hypothetical protein
MQALEMPALTAAQVDAVAQRDRTTHHVRLRTRAQMVLLAAEQHRGVREIAAMVRECQGTVRCWLKGYAAQGIEGLQEPWALVGGRSFGQGDCRLPGAVAAGGATSATQPGPALFHLDAAPAGRRAGGRAGGGAGGRGSGCRKNRCASRSQRPRLS